MIRFRQGFRAKYHVIKLVLPIIISIRKRFETNLCHLIITETDVLGTDAIQPIPTRDFPQQLHPLWDVIVQ